MGNCSQKGIADGCPNFIKILTESGSVLQFKNPKLARKVLEKYPGYGIFPPGHAPSPLADHQSLVCGQVYYLLPLDVMVKEKEQQHKKVAGKLHLESMEQMDPPKMSSADFVENLGTGSALQVLPSQGDGVWKVKLVISTKQLEEILSEQVNTEALIEKMRVAASSASLTPRRTKSSWVVGWKPVLSNVFKAPILVNKAMPDC